MKCHAGVEFPDGKPCPKCKAELGEVCWPGINADLLALPKMRKALEAAREWIIRNTDGENDPDDTVMYERGWWDRDTDLMDQIDDALKSCPVGNPREAGK